MSPPGRVVLVVDDDADVRLTIRRTLEPEFVVAEAASADGALVVVAEVKPAVILLDVSMPGRGGLDVLPELVAASPDARIVMLTGERDVAIAAQALSQGVSAYVTKPFDVDQLRAEVRGHEKASGDERPWRVKL